MGKQKNLGKTSRPVHVEVAAREGESIERLIKRFSRKVKKAEVIEKYKEKVFYIKPSTKRRRKKQQRLRIMRMLQKEQEEELIKSEN